MSRGRFISFEGPDGGGKSTQIRLLAERLRAQGHEVVENAEPGGTRIGQQIRQILLDKNNAELAPRAELLLYFASRAQAVAERIRPALERGAIVLSDRFTDSTLVYQGTGRGLGAEAVRAIHAIACEGLQPGLTLCLDIDYEHGLVRVRDRAEADRIERQAAEFHARVRQAYLDLAAAEPRRIKIIDASRSPEEVAEAIWRAVHE